MPGMRRAKQPTKMSRVPASKHLMCHCGRHAMFKGLNHGDTYVLVWWECSKGHRFQEVFFTGNNVVECVK